MATVLYRKNGGEVIKISLTDQPFTEANTNWWGVETDPAFPDGTDLRDLEGNLRVLGYAKFMDLSGSPTCRNATQGEIDNFPVAQAEDEDEQDATAAGVFLNLHPRWRKVYKAIAKVLIHRVLEDGNAKTNEMVTQWESFKASVIAAGNLNDIKTAVGALDTMTANLPPTATLAQFMSEITSELDKDD